MFYYKRETNQTSWTFPESEPSAIPKVDEVDKASTPAPAVLQENPSVSAQTQGSVPNAPTVAASPKTARLVPSGPASWRNGQKEIQDLERERERKRSPPPRDDKRLEQPHSTEQDRDVKRTRRESPPTGPAATASAYGNRHGPRSENALRRTYCPAIDPLQSVAMPVWSCQSCGRS